MRIASETKAKLRDMGAAEMLAALEAQDDELCAGMTFAERLQMATDEAHSAFITAKVENLTKRANLRYPQADVRQIDFDESRGIDRMTILELATCGYVERASNIVLEGFAGSGKTYLGCALAKEACKRRIRTSYVRMPELEELWANAKSKVGAEQKLIKKYGNFTVLVIDEWLLNKPSESFRMMLLELMERRYGASSTIFCTQFMQKDWHARLGGGVHADAIMDRIVHNAYWVNSGKANMRAKINKDI